MKLVEALEIIRRPAPEGAALLQVDLACGFTPLHLETFLSAELRRARPRRRIDVTTGLFDDLLGNLVRSADTPADVAVAAIEWPDLDPRLGLRRLGGGWRPDDVDDVVTVARRQAERLVDAIGRLAEAKPVVCALPTLPLLPVFVQPTFQSGPQELALVETVSAAAAELAGHGRIRLVSRARLDRRSPLGGRRDARSDVLTGFPYTLDHASLLAEQIVALVAPPIPKKGLITDLDDTLWSGIVGEVGSESVSWSAESGGHAHALYQQFLASLAAAGVLVGVASKNEPAIVDEVFERDDLLLPKEAIFPFEVHWHSKSESVARILEQWNISPDAVVFVDDSPLEIAEVQSAFPDVEGLVFPGADYGALLDLLARLRDAFGKQATSAEDAIRLQSLRESARFAATAEASTQSQDDFLRSVDGTLRFELTQENDQRAFELINKTNQFNLNGRRLGESEFARSLERPGAFLLTVAYTDKFGPLGKIAAVLGSAEEGRVRIDSWVMSCRAFSRRIEHHTLAYLLERLGAQEAVLSYEATERNGPLREFLESLGLTLSGGVARIAADAFLERTPARMHRVEVGVG